jgi:hypothetical protein
LKNPKYFYEKLLDNLAEFHEKQVEIIVKILEETRGISRLYLKDFLTGKLVRVFGRRFSLGFAGAKRIREVADGRIECSFEGWEF